MKILFIYRVYGDKYENPVIDNQINSLRKIGLVVDSFGIEKGGVLNYFYKISKLKNIVSNNSYDIIHSHYSYCGYLSIFSGHKNLICSFMGSDILKAGPLKKIFLKFISRLFFKNIIVKSQQMNIFTNAFLIPNGVDLENFRPYDKVSSIKKVNFESKFFNLIFVATDLNADVKNITLAKKTMEILGNKYKLHLLSNIPRDLLPYYYSAADLLLLTSKSEGSPNVVKEALACNCPVISTDVGDVKFIIRGLNSCKVVASNPNLIAKEILNFRTSASKKENLRGNVIHLGEDIIAHKLLRIYKNLLS